MKVSNLLGHVNQFIINDWDAFYFQSYDTMVCKVVQGDLGDNFTMLENCWSATTGKHMRAFLEEVFCGILSQISFITIKFLGTLRTLWDEWKQLSSLWGMSRLPTKTTWVKLKHLLVGT